MSVYPDHGTPEAYGRGCRCRHCGEWFRTHTNPLPGVCLDGPVEGATFDCGGVIVDVGGWRYGSSEQTEPGLVGYRWLGA